MNKKKSLIIISISMILLTSFYYFQFERNIKDELKNELKHERISKLVELNKNDKVNNENIVNLLQYCDLIEELKLANGK